MSNQKLGIIRDETAKLLEIIKLKELFRFKEFLVHYRYDFTPRIECSISELAWGFVKDPWFANDVAQNLEHILPDIREEPPAFVKEWEETSEKEDLTPYGCTMEVIEETVTVDAPVYSEESSSDWESSDWESDELPPLPILPIEEDIDYSDMPALEEVNSFEDMPTVFGKSYNDDIEELLDELDNVKIEADNRRYNEEFQNTMDTLDSLIEELENDYEKSIVNKEIEDSIPENLDDTIERAFTDYLQKREDLKKENATERQKLDESIANLKKVADENTVPVPVNVDRYHVAEEACYAQEVEIPSIEPNYILHMPKIEYVEVEGEVVEGEVLEEDLEEEVVEEEVLEEGEVVESITENVLVRVFTPKCLKWHSGPDLVDVNIPHTFFTANKNQTWGEDVSFEVTIDGVDLEADWDKWTAFVFERRAEDGTIRPSRMIEDYTVMSEYARNLGQRNNETDEVWILMLPIEEFDPKTQTVLHKKWFKKNWFYYRGFVLAENDEKLTSVFPVHTALYEEVSATNLNNLKIDSLDDYTRGSSVVDTELYTGDIVIYSKEDSITKENIEEAFDMIEYSKARKL